MKEYRDKMAQQNNGYQRKKDSSMAESGTSEKPRGAGRHLRFVMNGVSASF